MNSFIENQTEEIAISPTLRLYGFFLSLTHLWTFLYWNQNGFFKSSQGGINSEPICFPFFPNCDLWRASIGGSSWSVILFLYVFLALFTAFSFYDKKWTKLSWILFAFLSLYKLALHLSNYNFMGNYHYMIHVVSFLFLFLPHKKTLIKYAIVSFYVAAGFLKLNIDWLSGAAMISTPWLDGRFLSLSLYYVIFLELIIVFGLLHHLRWVRWAVLIQLIAFHAFSWHVVGFYYPSVMFCLLAIFFIDEWLEVQRKIEIPNHLLRFFTLRESKTVYGFLIFFASLQLLPFLVTKDPSLSGVARLSSLNMFDSKTECHPLLVVHKSGQVMHLDRPMKNLGVRLQCDPIVYLNQAHQLCRKNREHKEFDRLSLSLFSKRVTSQDYKKVLDIADVCQHENPLWLELSQVNKQ